MTRLVLALLCSVVLSCGDGCGVVGRSRARLNLSATTSSLIPLNFGEHEIATRTWRDADGRLFSLKDFQILGITNRPSIAVARYGLNDSGRIYCLDIYKRHTSVDENDVTLKLLCHDIRQGWVSGMDVEYQSNRVFLRLSREYPIQATSRLVDNAYAYEIKRDGTLVEMPGDFYGELRATK